MSSIQVQAPISAYSPEERLCSSTQFTRRFADNLFGIICVYTAQFAQMKEFKMIVFLWSIFCSFLLLNRQPTQSGVYWISPPVECQLKNFLNCCAVGSKSTKYTIGWKRKRRQNTVHYIHIQYLAFLVSTLPSTTFRCFFNVAIGLPAHIDTYFQRIISILLIFAQCKLSKWMNGDLIELCMLEHSTIITQHQAAEKK